MFDTAQENYTTKDGKKTNELENLMTTTEEEKQKEIEEKMEPFRREEADLKKELPQQVA